VSNTSKKPSRKTLLTHRPGLGWRTLTVFWVFLTFCPRQVGIEQSKRAASKALEVDETLAEAHFLLGTARLWEWSWSDAEKEFKQAIALEPNNTMAHQGYGYLLRAQGRFDEAIAEMRNALEHDPLTASKQQSLGATLYSAGRYDEALQQFREIPDPDANSERRHRWMSAIYERKGMQREAIGELLRALRLAGKKELAVSVERKYLSSNYAEAKEAFLRGISERHNAERRILLHHRSHLRLRLAMPWLEKRTEHMNGSISPFGSVMYC